MSSPPTRSPSPNQTNVIKGEKEKEGVPHIKRPNNGWTREQEELMAGWSDIATCYRWMHDRCEKQMNSSNMWITVPVIILSTLTGSASFVMNSLVGDNPNGQKYAQIGIGGVSIFTGILTTLGNFFRYAQNSESNRVASIAWGKFQRQIAVELALSPMERLDCSDFLNIARAELDRLIEQSPPIPDKIILEFEKEFEAIPALKRPDIAHGVEHTHIFRNTDTRLKQLAVDAVVYMKQKRKIWNESLAPDIDAKVKGEVSKVVPDLMERIKMLEGKLQEKEKEKLPARSPFIMRGRLRMPVSQSRPITPGPPNIILPGTPVQEPIEVLAQPVTEPVAQPVAQPVTEPVAQPVTQPLAQPLAQPLGTTVESTPPLPPLPPSPPVEVAGLLANLPAPNFVQSFDSSEASPDTIDQIVIEVEKKSDDEAAP
jgi:hypothetical protein